MRIATNEFMVGRNRKFATYLFFFSLAVLASGFLFANGLFGLSDVEEDNPGIYVIAMPIVLIVGFTTTIVSVRLTNLWIRVPRPEDAIQEGLKGISNKSALYNYFHLPARHVLVTHQGVFPIVTRFQDGNVIIKGNRMWQKRSPVTAIFSIFRMDGVGNPVGEAEAAAAYIENLLEEYDPDIPVYPVIVFHDPRVNLTFEEEAPIPVVYAGSKSEPSLRDYVRSKEKAEQLENNDQLMQFIRDFETYTI